MGNGSGFEVDAAAVDAVAGSLESAGSTLRGHRGDLEGSPDAGRSSGEVADALRLLAGALDGLAGHLDAMSRQASTAADRYRASDSRTRDRMGAP